MRAGKSQQRLFGAGGVGRLVKSEVEAVEEEIVVVVNVVQEENEEKQKTTTFGTTPVSVTVVRNITPGH